MTIQEIRKDIRILAVDDCLTIQTMMVQCLNELGFENITLADDGEEAINLVAKKTKEGMPFELIISDVRMPNMNGLDFLKLVRGAMKDTAVPFLMVSAENDQATVLEAISQGVDQYIIKPFTSDILATKLVKIFDKKKTL
jgi:two-component system chemotaxis response regulator CheY